MLKAQGLKMHDMKILKKIILLKLADKVRFHLNILPTMKKMETSISFKSNRKLCICYLLFSVGHVQATFPLISWNTHTKFEHKS